MQRHLVDLPAWEGGNVSEDPELGVTLVRGPGDGPDVSYAAMPRWDADTWAPGLAAVTARMQADGAWPSLLWCDPLDQPPGLDGELQKQGWVKALGETVLWTARAPVVPHLDPSLRIEAVQPRSMVRHEALEREVFGLAADQVERRRAGLAAALEAGRVRAWIVWLGDEPVAVARLSQGHGVAALQGIGVVEDHRGEGIGTLITTIATRAGLAVGNRLVWLSVRADNRAAWSIYARLGFAPAFAWTRWLVTADPRRGP
jgi:ribosomal protein S18 acetylase RimI-like enzyme